MWELILEFDYQTIRHALWAGYLLTFVLPIAAFYFTNKNQTSLNDKYQASVHSNLGKLLIFTGSVFHSQGFRRFFTYIRQKDSPDDSEEPSLLFMI